MVGGGAVDGVAVVGWFNDLDVSPTIEGPRLRAAWATGHRVHLRMQIRPDPFAQYLREHISCEKCCLYSLETSSGMLLCRPDSIAYIPCLHLLDCLADLQFQKFGIRRYTEILLRFLTDMLLVLSGKLSTFTISTRFRGVRPMSQSRIALRNFTIPEQIILMIAITVSSIVEIPVARIATDFRGSKSCKDSNDSKVSVMNSM